MCANYLKIGLILKDQKEERFTKLPNYSSTLLRETKIPPESSAGNFCANCLSPPPAARGRKCSEEGSAAAGSAARRVREGEGVHQPARGGADGRRRRRRGRRNGRSQAAGEEAETGGGGPAEGLTTSSSCGVKRMK